MIGKAILRYRILEKLSAGGRYQCVEVSSHADQNWDLCRSA